MIGKNCEVSETVNRKVCGKVIPIEIKMKGVCSDFIFRNKSENLSKCPKGTEIKANRRVKFRMKKSCHRHKGAAECCRESYKTSKSNEKGQLSDIFDLPFYHPRFGTFFWSHMPNVNPMPYLCIIENCLSWRSNYLCNYS